MTRACFFDLYNTLVYYSPTREERQCLAARQFGFSIDHSAMQRAYVVGEQLWTLENAKGTIQRRTRDEQRRFLSGYEKAILAEAGIEVTEDEAYEIYRAYRQFEAELRLFDDVWPTLEALKGTSLRLGVVSNWERDLSGLCDQLGLAGYLDLTLSSSEVGVEKPDVRIFEEALRRCGVGGADTVHVGDQYHSDVTGARRAGIRAVLLDRLGFLSEFDDCERIGSLLEVPALIGFA